jgi:hypothetical protein
MLRDHFHPVDLRYMEGHAFSCNHCGSLVTTKTWELHVVACPALARNLETGSAEHNRQRLLENLEIHYRQEREYEKIVKATHLGMEPARIDFDEITQIPPIMRKVPNPKDKK